jgi:hypothetical protein
MNERIDVKTKFVKKAPSVFLLVVCIRTGNSHMVHTSRLMSFCITGFAACRLWVASLEPGPPRLHTQPDSTYTGQMSQMLFFPFLQSS